VCCMCVLGECVWESDDVLVCVCGRLSRAGLSDMILLLVSIVLWGSQCCSAFGRVLQCFLHCIDNTDRLFL